MTTTATVAARWEQIRSAVETRKPIWIAYHGRNRLVCPHALGWKTNRAMLLAYQTGGHTTTGTLPADPHQRWRCLYLDQIDHIQPADETSPWQTADNYNHAHPFPAIDTVTIAIPPPHTGGVR
jgi:predicted DNA-binding transcriptional regulator YafY